MLHIKHHSDSVPEVALTVSNHTLARVVLVVVITLALIAAFLKITHALLLIFIAFFLAVALNAPVAKLASIIPGSKKGSRSIGTTLAFLLVIIVLGGFLADVLPPLISHTTSFVKAFPSLLNNSTSQHTALGHFIRRNHLQNTVQSLAKQIKVHFGASTAFQGVASIASSVVSLLAVLVLTFMMLVEGPHWVVVAREIFIPKHRQKQYAKVQHDMYQVVKGYVNGQVALALIAAILISPALFLLHVSYPVALIVVVFLCGLIPLIGHTIGAVIISAVALFHSLTAAIIILIYYFLYMQFENYFLQPKLQANTTNLSPLLVFGSIIIGVDLGGIFGGLVAIPVAACTKVIVIEYLDQRRLADSSDR